MKPANEGEIQELARGATRLWVRGGGTKTALAPRRDDLTVVDTGGLRGLLTHVPEEYTFTAYAGTPLAEVADYLSVHGQFLPFEPPFAAQGATLGGTVAAGLSGPSGYLYGGVRDYLLGIDMVAADGQLIRAGGQVVKNAAGFDLAKLVVGSLGMYGVLTRLSFKVFPSPSIRRMWAAEYPSMQAALKALIAVSASPLEIVALELEPVQNTACRLLSMLAGQVEVVARQGKRLETYLSGAAVSELSPEALAAWTAERSEFSWAPQEWALVKVPLTPGQALALDVELAACAAERRYGMGANLAWVSWPAELEALDQILGAQGLSGLVLRGRGGPRLGALRGAEFARRVRQALDPAGKFVLGDVYLGAAYAA